MKRFFFILALATALFVPFAASHAQLSAGLNKLDAANQSTGLSRADLGETVGGIIKVVLSLIGTIFLVLIIYAGILWMTARGAEEQITTSKNIIRAAIIGLAITLSAYAITYFIGSRLANANSGGNAVDSEGRQPCAQIGGTCGPWNTGDNRVPVDGGYCPGANDVCLK